MHHCHREQFQITLTCQRFDNREPEAPLRRSLVGNPLLVSLGPLYRLGGLDSRYFYGSGDWESKVKETVDFGEDSLPGL